MSQGATAAIKPCGRARQELIELLKGANHDSASNAFKMYFFTNTPGTKKHPPRDDLDDDIPRCLQCGHTIAEHGSTTFTEPAAHRVRVPGSGDAFGPLHSFIRSESFTRDAVLLHVLWLSFRPGLEVFGRVNAPSDSLSSNATLRSIMEEKASKGCVVCGFKRGMSAREYPCEAAQKYEVSVAHILPTRKDCETVGVPFDESNFLPLCGAKDEVPSCHSAFRRFLLCFVKATEGDHLWEVRASNKDYARFNWKIVDLSDWKPHRRSLHAHAFHCHQTFQVEYQRGVDTSLLNAAPPELLDDDDPAPDCSYD